MISIVSRVFRALNPRSKSRWQNHDNDNPTLLDARRYMWGRHVSFEQDRSKGVRRYDITDSPIDNGTYFEVWGHWRPRPRLGDRVIKDFETGPKVLEFVSVDYCPDPNDMFFGTVKYLCPLAELVRGDEGDA